MFFSFHWRRGRQKPGNSKRRSDAGVPFFFPLSSNGDAESSHSFLSLAAAGFAPDRNNESTSFQALPSSCKNRLSHKIFCNTAAPESPEANLRALTVQSQPQSLRETPVYSLTIVLENPAFCSTFTAAPISSAAQSVTATAPASSAKHPTCSSFPAGTSLRYPSVTCYAPSGTSVKKQTPFVYMKIF